MGDGNAGKVLRHAMSKTVSDGACICAHPPDSRHLCYHFSTAVKFNFWRALREGRISQKTMNKVSDTCGGDANSGKRPSNRHNNRNPWCRISPLCGFKTDYYRLTSTHCHPVCLLTDKMPQSFPGTQRTGSFLFRKYSSVCARTDTDSVQNTGVNAPPASPAGPALPFLPYNTVRS